MRRYLYETDPLRDPNLDNYPIYRCQKIKALSKEKGLLVRSSDPSCTIHPFFLEDLASSRSEGLPPHPRLRRAGNGEGSVALRKVSLHLVQYR